MVYAPVLHRPQDLAIANRVHLHLLSDSTGETLEMLAKAALAQFEDADVIRHFWPMVRSRQHLERILPELKDNPGLVLFTLVNPDTRNRLEEACTQLGLPAVPILDRVTEALEKALGQQQAATMWFMNNAMQNPNHLGAGAHHYMHMMGIVTLGWMWLRMAKVAQAALAAGTEDKAFYEAKLATARYYMDRYLPDAGALRRKLEAGSDSTMALGEEAFATAA